MNELIVFIALLSLLYVVMKVRSASELRRKLRPIRVESRGRNRRGAGRR